MFELFWTFENEYACVYPSNLKNLINWLFLT